MKRTMYRKYGLRLSVAVFYEQKARAALAEATVRAADKFDKKDGRDGETAGTTGRANGW